MLKAYLLGPGQARYADQPLEGFPNQQHYRLLCQLLLNRHHPHNRERFAAVFWDEYPTTTSRTHLRRALWQLRNALQSTSMPEDKHLIVRQDSISFLSSGPYWLNAEVLEATLDCCQELPGQELADFGRKPQFGADKTVIYWT